MGVGVVATVGVIESGGAPVASSESHAAMNRVTVGTRRYFSMGIRFIDGCLCINVCTAE